MVTNRVLDLIAEGVDLAIRAGELADSRLIAKRFTVGHVGLWASPAYLKKRGMPSHPRDLAPQECLRFSLFKNNRLELTNGKDSVRLVPAGRLRADDFEALKAFALLGEGIVYLPSFMCAEEVKQSRLQRVLPDWHGTATTFSLVYPAQRFVSPKVRHECRGGILDRPGSIHKRRKIPGIAPASRPGMGPPRDRTRSLLEGSGVRWRLRDRAGVSCPSCW